MIRSRFRLRDRRMPTNVVVAAAGSRLGIDPHQSDLGTAGERSAGALGRREAPAQAAMDTVECSRFY